MQDMGSDKIDVPHLKCITKDNPRVYERETISETHK
jgi:hypothetical protein